MVTQMFFDNAKYFEFVAKAHENGNHGSYHSGN
jgi:5,10-methylenetetrahydrofolate reductase